MAGAHTLYIPGDNDDYRLLGPQGFLFFPTLDWQARLAGAETSYEGPFMWCAVLQKYQS